MWISAFVRHPISAPICEYQLMLADIQGDSAPPPAGAGAVRLPRRK